MRKNIYIPEKMHKRVKMLSALEELSESELFRRSFDMYYANHDKKEEVDKIIGDENE